MTKPETDDERKGRRAARDARLAKQQRALLAAALGRRAAVQPAIDAADAEVDAARAALLAFDAKPERRQLVNAWNDARAKAFEARRAAHPPGGSMNPRKP